MNTALIILIVLFALATAAALVKGVITMAQGKDITGRQSNKLMSYRVALQLATVILVVIMLVIARSHR